MERSMNDKEETKMTPDYRRQRGVVMLGEEDLLRMLNLPEGYYIMGVKDAFMNVGVKIMICGPGLTEVAEGAEAPWIPSTRTMIFDPDSPNKVIGMRIDVNAV
jgi:hypothetical protein